MDIDTGFDVYVDQKREFLNSYFKDSTENIASIIPKLNDDWIKAVYYTTSRSKKDIYWDSIFKAYNAGILDTISWDNVKIGSQEFKNLVDKMIK